MSSTRLVLDTSQPLLLVRRIERLADADRRDLLEPVGALIVSQAQQRLADAGGGASAATTDLGVWPAWSASYLNSRHGGHSLLRASGALLEDLDSRAESGYVEVGGSLIQNAILQFGGTEGMAPGPAAIPARPYLGISAANAAEIVAEVDDWVNRRLGSA